MVTSSYRPPSHIDVAGGGNGSGLASSQRRRYRLYCIVYRRPPDSDRPLDALCLFRTGQIWYQYDAFRTERPIVEVPASTDDVTGSPSLTHNTDRTCTATENRVLFK